MPGDNDNVVSLSGHAVYVHKDASAWQAPVGEAACLAQISAHLTENLGEVESVFHEIVSDTVHIDVHWVKPGPRNPYHRLITSGMSDLPMCVPADFEGPRYMELMITLPHDWQIGDEAFKDESWYWPLRLLKFLARLPHKYETWLGYGHTVPNGDPAEPYAPNAGFSGCIILPSVSVPATFYELPIDAEKTITFLSAVPLHEGEMNLKLRKGVDALLDLFDRKNIRDVVTPGRPDVTRKRFGFL